MKPKPQKAGWPASVGCLGFAAFEIYLLFQAVAGSQGALNVLCLIQVVGALSSVGWLIVGCVKNISDYRPFWVLQVLTLADCFIIYKMAFYGMWFLVVCAVINLFAALVIRCHEMQISPSR